MDWYSSYQNVNEAFVDIPGLSDTLLIDIDSEVFPCPQPGSRVDYPSSHVTGSDVATQI